MGLKLKKKVLYRRQNTWCKLHPAVRKRSLFFHVIVSGCISTYSDVAEICCWNMHSSGFTTVDKAYSILMFLRTVESISSAYSFPCFYTVHHVPFHRQCSWAAICSTCIQSSPIELVSISRGEKFRILEARKGIYMET